MKSKQGAVFISYAREDQESANCLYQDLKSAGLAVWIDTEDLRPGEKWKSAVTEAIRRSRYFLALLSNNSIGKRGFVQKELRVALSVLDEIPDSEIYLIPIRLENCRVEGKLAELNWLDMFPDWRRGVRLLLTVLWPASAIQEIFSSRDRLFLRLQEVLRILLQARGKMTPHEIERKFERGRGRHRGDASAAVNPVITSLRDRGLLEYERGLATYGRYWLAKPVREVLTRFLDNSPSSEASPNNSLKSDAASGAT